jgi:peptide chain release factor 2
VQPEPSREQPVERLAVREGVDGRERTMDLRQIEGAIEELHARVERHIDSDHYRALQDQAQTLMDQMGQPNFWDDRLHVRQTLSTVHRLKLVADRFADLRNRADGLGEKARMIRLHGDAGGLRELASNYESLERDIALAELELMAGDEDGPAADGACVCITPLTMPRAAEASEWAQSLAAMYTAWAERKGYEIESVHEDGAPPMLVIRGVNVARILLGEDGIHKLHAELPSGQEGKRARAQVRLARIEVLPLTLSAEREDDADERHDVVRVTVLDEIAGQEPDRPNLRLVEAVHAATGLTLRLEAERADDVAGAVVAARLCRMPRGNAMGADEAVARIYYLAHSQHVRDPRSGHREGRPRDVLRGAIDGFLFAFLKSEQERGALAAATVVAAEKPEVEAAPAKKASRARRAATARTTPAPRVRRAARPD